MCLNTKKKDREMNSLSYKDNRNYLVNLLAAALSNTTTTSA